MFDQVREAIGLLRAAVSALEGPALAPDDALELLACFAEAERLSAAGRTRLAARAEESRVWKREGHRTFATWLARQTGARVGDAIATVETSKKLAALPATRSALAEGLLSDAQAREIATAALDAPAAETKLLETARTETLRTLTEECRRVSAAAAPDDAARYRKIYEQRYFRHRMDPDGAIKGEFCLPPDLGGSVIAAVEGLAGRMMQRARRAGRPREPFHAHAADALVQLVQEGAGGSSPSSSPSGSVPRSGPRAMMHVVVDAEALMRGKVAEGERCEIPGVGPIPVTTARALMGDAILKVLVTKGKEVVSVAHGGRNIRAHHRTALEVRDPTCVVPGCDETRALQIDHVTPWGFGGPTSVENTARECPWHHYLKTYCGYQLLGGPDAREWISPDEAEGITGNEARPPPPAA